MAFETHNARVLVPIPNPGDPDAEKIPAGPCLIEGIDAHLVELIWGPTGQESARFPVATLKSAADRGDLVLLD